MVNHRLYSDFAFPVSCRKVNCKFRETRRLSSTHVFQSLKMEREFRDVAVFREPPTALLSCRAVPQIIRESRSIRAARYQREMWHFPAWYTERCAAFCQKRGQFRYTRASSALLNFQSLGGWLRGRITISLIIREISIARGKNRSIYSTFVSFCDSCYFELALMRKLEIKIGIILVISILCIFGTDKILLCHKILFCCGGTNLCIK